MSDAQRCVHHNQCANFDSVDIGDILMDNPSQPRIDAFDGAMRHIFDAAGVTRGMVRELDAETKCAKRFVHLQPSAQLQVVHVMERCLMTMAKLLMASDADGLYDACIGRGDLTWFITSMVDGYRACPRGSLERRMLRALMASCSHDALIAAFMK